MCIFCKIINKQREAYTVFENKKLTVILDIDPIHEGHVLIIPKEHQDSIDKISEDTLSEVMKTAKKVVTALNEIYGNPGYSIMQNGGKFCDFGHLHFHVFPRYENDGFGYKYSEGNFTCSEKIAKKLREKLENIQS